MSKAKELLRGITVGLARSASVKQMPNLNLEGNVRRYSTTEEIVPPISQPQFTQSRAYSTKINKESGLLLEEIKVDVPTVPFESTLDYSKVKFDDQKLSESTRGQDTIITASHDVRKGKIGKDQYAFKLMNWARIGERGEQKEYPPQEVMKQATMEVLAMRLGNLFCPGQFPEGNILKNGDDVYVTTKFINNAISLRDIRSRHGMEHQNRDETPFYLGEAGIAGLQTKMHLEPEVKERLLLPSGMKQDMAGKPKNEQKPPVIHDAIVDGRVALKIALYILGENDEVHNRDGNILMLLCGYEINQDRTEYTPKVKPVAVDCGLSFQRPAPKDLVDAAYKLAIRETDSPNMGMELPGDISRSNLRNVKNYFLTNLIPIFESGKVDSIIEEAKPFLDQDAIERVEDMKSRLTVCYLAGKCIERGLDRKSAEEAKDFMKEVLAQVETVEAGNSKTKTNSNSTVPMTAAQMFVPSLGKGISSAS